MRVELLFALALIVALLLIWKTVADFLSIQPVKNTTPAIQNMVLIIVLIHGIHIVRKHYRRRRLS